MTKSGLIDVVAGRTGLPRKVVESLVNTMFGSMTGAMQRGDRIEIRGFGNFKIRKYDGYTGRNPKTGKPLAVSAKVLPHFKVGKDLRERLLRPKPARKPA
jgi:integration host factor subunit beta